MNDFFHQIGKTMEAWAFIESSLCTLFIKVTRMHPPMGRKLFYASAGFRARARNLRIAMNCVNIDEDQMREFWTEAIGKAEQYSAFRNLMAHGDILYVNTPKSKHYKTHVILQGREFWKADLSPENVITLEQLVIADANFRHLGGCMMFILSRDPKTTKVGPRECRELVALLPQQPQSSFLSEPDLARFSVIASTISINR
jgi:hypothetical protein